MLARLCRGPASVSELAKPLTMSLPAVVQHLQVLEGSGLVRSRKIGLPARAPGAAAANGVNHERTIGGATRLIFTEQAAFLDDFDDGGGRERGTGVLLDQLGADLRRRATGG